MRRPGCSTSRRAATTSGSSAAGLQPRSRQARAGRRRVPRAPHIRGRPLLHQRAAARGSLELLTVVVVVLERDRTLVNQLPYGKPQLGRQGVYRTTGATPIDSRAAELARLWVLSLSDGTRSLLDVAKRVGLSFSAVADAASVLKAAGLLAEAPG